MKKGLMFLAASVFLVASSSAYSEAYVGISVGQSDYGDDGFGFDKGTSFGILGGYKFNEFLAIEGGYNDLGDAKDDTAPIWTASGRTINLSAVAMLPVSEYFDIYAKVGAYNWDASISEDGYGKFASADGTDLGYGGGVNVNFTDSVGMFVEYMGLNVDGDDASNISAGLKISFGGTKKTNAPRVASSNSTDSSQQRLRMPTNGVGSQLRALDAEGRDDCEFITSITRGVGGPGDTSQYIESAMEAALTEAAKYGADSYFVVNTDMTESGAAVVLEAFKCE